MNPVPCVITNKVKPLSQTFFFFEFWIKGVTKFSCDQNSELK